MTTVIWIDWYSYHVSRFRALCEHASLGKAVTGIELVGGCGVHKGLRFRDNDRSGLPILSLFPDADWEKTTQWALARGLWSKLGELNPSAVLVPGWYTVPGLAAAVWAKVNGKRSILMSETTEHDHPRVWWKEAAKKLLIRTLFDASIAGGKPHTRYLERLGFAGSKIAQFYDVVDNGFYRKAAESVRRQPDLRDANGLPENYFLYVGRLAPEKNLALSLRAFADYRKQGGQWTYVLVGDGPDRTSLEMLAVELGVSGCVVFAGLKNSRETTAYYAFAGCFVLPSSREPWGLVVNEAMASGLPVIVSQRCGCSEDLVRDGGNGYLFNPFDERALTTCFLSIERKTREERASFGQESLCLIAQFTPENWAAEVARLVA